MWKWSFCCAISLSIFVALSDPIRAIRYIHWQITLWHVEWQENWELIWISIYIVIIGNSRMWKSLIFDQWALSDEICLPPLKFSEFLSPYEIEGLTERHLRGLFRKHIEDLCTAPTIIPAVFNQWNWNISSTPLGNLLLEWNNLFLLSATATKLN